MLPLLLPLWGKLLPGFLLYMLYTSILLLLKLLHLLLALEWKLEDLELLLPFLLQPLPLPLLFALGLDDLQEMDQNLRP